jgi:hypothetical protein
LQHGASESVLGLFGQLLEQYDAAGTLRRGRSLEPGPKLLELALQQGLPGLGVRVRGDELVDPHTHFVSPTIQRIHTATCLFTSGRPWRPSAFA